VVDGASYEDSYCCTENHIQQGAVAVRLLEKPGPLGEVQIHPDVRFVTGSDDDEENVHSVLDVLPSCVRAFPLDQGEQADSCHQGDVKGAVQVDAVAGADGDENAEHGVK